MGVESAQYVEKGMGLGEAEGRSESLAEGVFMGARVTPDSDPMSLLADAAEELTFSLAESEESRLDERKEKTGTEKKRAFDPFIEAARKLVRDSGEKFGRAMDHLERLFKTRNNAALAELMDALGRVAKEEGHDDPADAFVLLAGLKDRLGGGHPLAGTVDLALEELAAKESFAVASGLAADSATPHFADMTDADLRSAYRGAVADFGSPREALTRLCERFGVEKLDRGLDFLMTVLGNELSSSGPSVEKSRLKALTGDIAVVRVLGAARTRCASVLERLDKAHGVKSPVGAEPLLDALLSARDNQYAGAQDFQRMAALAGTPDTEREVLFLQDLLQALRELPDIFYDGNEARLRTQAAAQSALDDAVRREEEELGF
ncbi:MAG: TyeA family type III secretion system gatekeeper subunit [Desulfovibrio sp.]|jgi:type III secretion protein W|nr:TyeA family type III secretion system gatekeeper subunit [Desulfovibrio sp.]